MPNIMLIYAVFFFLCSLYRQRTHVFRILREIDLLYEYYGHFHHVIDKTKNIGGTVPV